MTFWVWRIKSAMQCGMVKSRTANISPRNQYGENKWTEIQVPIVMHQENMLSCWPNNKDVCCVKSIHVFFWILNWIVKIWWYSITKICNIILSDDQWTQAVEFPGPSWPFKLVPVGLIICAFGFCCGDLCTLGIYSAEKSSRQRRLQPVIWSKDITNYYTPRSANLNESSQRT